MKNKNEKIRIVYKGNKNKTKYPEFIEICKQSQIELSGFLYNKLLHECGFNFEDIIVGQGFIYAKGAIPILLTAHMDTVHKENVIDFYEWTEDGKTHISSPQGIGGDDRCGIYMILEILKTHKCSVLFCEDEEVGGLGSNAFCYTEWIKDLSQMKYLIELDRANEDDAVFYSCDNKEFTEFIVNNTGYTENWGSFSDISHLAPQAGVAAVNLSCGYYNAHRKNEYVVVEEMLNTIDVVKKLLDVECEQFEYIPARGWKFGKLTSYYDDYYDDYYMDDYYNYSPHEDFASEIVELSVWYKRNGQDDYDITSGISEEEAWGRFFLKHPETSFSQVIEYDFEIVQY